MLKIIFEKYYNFTKGKYPFFKYCPSIYQNYFLLKKYADADLYNTNFENPKSFNEKIRYLINNEKLELKTRLTDKLLVKDYVNEKIGVGHCPQIFGAWKNFSEIDFNKLPNSFALKANHGCKMNLFIANKNNLSNSKKKHIKKIADNWLKVDYSVFSLEPQYKKIERKLFAEKLRYNAKGFFECDYQIHCFNGEPKFIEVEPPTGALNSNLLNVIQFYDRDWNLQPFTYYWDSIGEPIEKPVFIDEMCEYAKILSKDFAYVRIDFTMDKNNVNFVEMTFSPSAGMVHFNLPEFDFILGEMIKLP